LKIWQGQTLKKYLRLLTGEKLTAGHPATTKAVRLASDIIMLLKEFILACKIVTLKKIFQNKFTKINHFRLFAEKNLTKQLKKLEFVK